MCVFRCQVLCRCTRCPVPVCRCSVSVGTVCRWRAGVPICWYVGAGAVRRCAGVPVRVYPLPSFGSVGQAGLRGRLDTRVRAVCPWRDAARGMTHRTSGPVHVYRNVMLQMSVRKRPRQIGHIKFRRTDVWALVHRALGQREADGTVVFVSLRPLAARHNGTGPHVPEKPWALASLPVAVTERN